MIRTLIITLLVQINFTFAQNACPVIPQPNTIQTEEGHFIISKKLSVQSNTEDAKDIVSYLKSGIQKYSKRKIHITHKKNVPVIYLELISDHKMSRDAYALTVTKQQILLKATDVEGLFYGAQSILQLCASSPTVNGMTKIRCCKINDEPHYKWRGLMLDESRHFFGTKKVKQLLDYMALHKLNVFHWHLTDAPGWRIEIRQYPKLTKVGGIGNDHDPMAKAAFYTQKEIKEIVKYAAERHIEIIPEIDMPGHASAANRAYPEYSGGGSEKHPEFTFNPGKEEVYQYLTNILKEVNELFPSQYIHLGGDEVHFGNQQWKTNEDVQRLMKTENLKDLKEVEQYFIRRMADSVKMMGKKVMGWDEVVASGLDKKSTRVMWWRHDKPHLLSDAIKKGYEVIMCPRIPMYFDFIQSEKHDYGRTWNGFCDLESVYNFPKDDLRKDDQIKGIQACIWTENIQNNERLDFMTFPRLSAMSEAAWTHKRVRDYDDFKDRLLAMMKIYQKDKLYYYDVFNPEKHKEPEGIKKR